MSPPVQPRSGEERSPGADGSFGGQIVLLKWMVALNMNHAAKLSSRHPGNPVGVVLAGGGSTTVQAPSTVTNAHIPGTAALLGCHLPLPALETLHGTPYVTAAAFSPRSS